MSTDVVTSASEFFSVDRVTGDVRVAKQLSTDVNAAENYTGTDSITRLHDPVPLYFTAHSLLQFEVIASDSAPDGRRLSDSAVVTILVNRSASVATTLRFEQVVIQYAMCTYIHAVCTVQLCSLPMVFSGALWLKTRWPLLLFR